MSEKSLFHFGKKDLYIDYNSFHFQISFHTRSLLFGLPLLLTNWPSSMPMTPKEAASFSSSDKRLQERASDCCLMEERESNG